MAARGVETEVLDARALHDLEPALRPVFARALWLKDSLSVDDPGALVAAYARAFADRGGRIERAAALGIERAERGVRVRLEGGGAREADAAVVALGAWSRRVLEASGYRVRLGYERGHHRHFAGPRGANAALTRPVHDAQGGYVLAPMRMGLRLTTGVELREPDTPSERAQLALAERAAREIVDLGDRTEAPDWSGTRPTFPDSRPAIGPLPGLPGAWACFGHQHIGFTTGPGSARLLGEMMDGAPPSIDPAPFRPARYVRRR